MFATTKKNCIICLLLIHLARSYARPPADNKVNHFYDNIFIQCLYIFFLFAESAEQITVIIIICMCSPSKWSPWDSRTVPSKKWRTAFSTLAWFNRRRWIFATRSTVSRCSLFGPHRADKHLASGLRRAFFLHPIPLAAAEEKIEEICEMCTNSEADEKYDRARGKPDGGRSTDSRPANNGKRMHEMNYKKLNRTRIIFIILCDSPAIKHY